MGLLVGGMERTMMTWEQGVKTHLKVGKIEEGLKGIHRLEPAIGGTGPQQSVRLQLVVRQFVGHQFVVCDNS